MKIQIKKIILILFFLFTLFGMKNTFSSYKSDIYSAGYNGSCTIQNTGYIACWGSASPYNNPSLIPNIKFKKIVAGYSVCGLTADDEIVCFGTESTPSNFLGQKFLDFAMFDSAAGAMSMCAIKLDNTVLCNQSRGLSGFYSYITLAGYNGPCGIRLDGTLSCNTNSTYIDSTPSGSFISVSADYNGYGCGVTTSNSMVCWGVNQPVFPLGEYFSLSSYGNATTCAIKTNTIYCRDLSYNSPVGIQFKSVSVGNSRVCGMTTSNLLYCYTNNSPINTVPPGIIPLSPPSQKVGVCQDYTSSIPSLTNEQKYNLQGQTFNSGFIQNTVSGKNIYGFWFNKNSNGTGSFLNYFISNLDSFNDVKFYNSSNIEQTSTGGILQTFTNYGYYLLDNYFFAKGTVNDPGIYLNTFNKFQKINVKSTDVYAYRLYRKVEGEWTLILKNCITNTVCDISQVSSTLWYNSYDEILIVPFSTSGYVKFTDYKINDIEIYSYTSEYVTYPVCYYEDGSIDVNGQEFTPEEWEEYKENEIKNGEAKPTAYCNELNFFQYIKDPVCLSSGLSTWFQKNIGTSPAYQYFMKFLNFISYKIEPSTQISIFFFDANLVGFNEYKLNLDPENLNFENYGNYEPDFETDNGKILLYTIKGLFIIFFYVLIFIFIFLVFFVHNFIFSGFLKVIKMAFPNLLDFNFKEKMNFISYIALIPLITVFLFLFNTFLLEYILIFKNTFTQVFNILGLIFDTLYGVFTSDFGGFIIFFNIINTYLTGAFIIALFAIILIKYGRL